MDKCPNHFCIFTTLSNKLVCLTICGTAENFQMKMSYTEGRFFQIKNKLIFLSGNLLRQMKKTKKERYFVRRSKRNWIDKTVKRHTDSRRETEKERQNVRICRNSERDRHRERKAEKQRQRERQAEVTNLIYKAQNIYIYIYVRTLQKSKPSDQSG